jgi:hypothetical protein
MKAHHARSALMLIAWFLAIPLLGPDGTFPMCMKGNKPVECEKWKVLGKFSKYDDCFNAQMETRSKGLVASHDIPSAAKQVQALRAACLRDGDPRLSAK